MARNFRKELNESVTEFKCVFEVSTGYCGQPAHRHYYDESGEVDEAHSLIHLCDQHTLREFKEEHWGNAWIRITP